MEGDLHWALEQRRGKPRCEILQADARSFIQQIPPNSIDLLITSPPYLNNYDYADRTRLEMYFFGWAHSWRDITEVEIVTKTSLGEMKVHVFQSLPEAREFLEGLDVEKLLDHSGSPSIFE